MNADTYDMAFFWLKVRSPFWILGASVLLHFVIYFIGTEKEKRKKALWCIYLPGLFFFVLDLFTNILTGDPVRRSYGWTYQSSETLWDYLWMLWVFIATAFAVRLLVREFSKNNESREKRKILIVLLGFFIAIIFAVFDLAMKQFKLSNDIPELANLGMGVQSLMIGYGIWKYELFTLSVSSAVREVFSSVSDIIFLIEVDGRINKINKIGSKIFGVPASEIVGMDIRGYVEISAQEEDRSLKTNVDFLDYISVKDTGDYEMRIKTKKDQIYSFSVSKIKGSDNKVKGFILIGRDISMRKDYEQKLKTQTDELKRINELMVGREMKLLEMKKKITELEKRKGYTD